MPGGFPWSAFGFGGDAKTEDDANKFSNEQFGGVFEEMMREEGLAEENNQPTSKFWSIIGAVSGGAIYCCEHAWSHCRNSSRQQIGRDKGQERKECLFCLPGAGTAREDEVVVGAGDQGLCACYQLNDRHGKLGTGV